MTAPRKLYVGSRVRGIARVTVNGCALPLRLDLSNHSPTGFEWGYGGSGPAQLALAMLADFLGDDAAMPLYQDFKREVIASLGDDWRITGEMLDLWHRSFLRKLAAQERAERVPS